MGLIPQKPYKTKNKTTGLFEWVYPKSIEYTSIKEPLKPVILENHNKRKKRG